MSKRAKEAALKAYPDKVFRYKKIGDADGVMTGESVISQQYIRDYFIEGYEQGEKETIERACKWLEQALTHGCHPCSGSRLVIEFKQAMEEKK